MKTELREYTVQELLDGFVYSELENKGLFGLSGQLTIQPEYQRNYIYIEKRRDVGVINSVLNSYPLGLHYFNKLDNGKLEVLDGQQRITSLGRFVTGKFAIIDNNDMPQFFGSLPTNQQQRILDTRILVYICEGTEDEIKDWFQIINEAGVELRTQERLNAVYSGPFVTAGKAEFSNSRNSNVQKWSTYINANLQRQGYWETALDWVSDGNIEQYMSKHRNDDHITEVTNYFNTVIDWIGATFTSTHEDMRGLDWGRLYRKHHKTAYNPAEIDQKIQDLYQDDYIENHRGIYEYVLGGEEDTTLLNIRVFNNATKRSIHAKQTAAAKKNKTSNCPLCALGKDNNSTRIWELNEMEADHVTAWSKGGATDPSNCQMLCKTHNRIKGNR